MTDKHKVSTVSASEGWFDTDTGSLILNDSAVPNDEIMSAIMDQRPEMAGLMKWQRSMSRGSGGIFQRDRFMTPERIFDQFKVARDAALHDDVVSGVIEMTESMAFSRVSFYCEDEDQEDIWNQIARDVDLDSRLREMWRELSICSQYYVAVLYGTKDYKVRGKSEKGVKRKKEFNKIRVPLGLSILDPLKVIPVGNFMFGKEQLAYIADRQEAVNFDEVLANTNSSDLVVKSLLTGRYTPSAGEKKILQEATASDLTNLYTLNPDTVFRHTMTRPSYERFADCRMAGIFELLDLKNQLREMDRASLLGGTNFIVLVRIGSDALPARQQEINALSGMVQTAARMPIMVGDHRLEVEIVTPKQDFTLKPERYNTIDARITSRMFDILMTGNYASGTKGDDSVKLSRISATSMESRRHMMARSIERNIIKRTMELNPNRFDEEPVLEFHPKRIALDFDPTVAQFYQDLRDRGDIARQTVLDQVDLDESGEARKREREKEQYDKIFTPTTVPFDKPTGGPGMEGPQSKPAKPGDNQNKPGETPRAAGRNRGGTKNGGGATPNAGRPPSQSTEEDE